MSDAERIYREWHEAFCGNDVAALVRLYAPDATIESPSMPYLMERAEGICRGTQEIREYYTRVMRHKPKQPFFRTPLLAEGSRLMWEYPRETPTGEQMEFVEVMDLAGGVIARHRIYWGWGAMEQLARAQLPEATAEQALSGLFRRPPPTRSSR